jgi:hypothetical protein
MHILGLKWHSKFSPASVFSSIKPKKNSKQKNNSTPFEAHMQETMQFTAYLQGFVNIQDPRHLKIPFFPQKCLLFLSPLKMKTSKKQGPKIPGKR